MAGRAVEVTELGFGGASIGELFVRVPEARRAGDRWRPPGTPASATSTPRPGTAAACPSCAPARACATIRAAEFALSTKVGRWLRPASAEGFDGAPWLGGRPNEVVFDYTYDGIMRSVEQSRLRLGITRFDVAFIHDLDHLYFDAPTIDAHFRDLAGSGWRALEELRSSGQIGAIGAGINDLGLIPRFLDLGDIDAFLVAMPYTLLAPGRPRRRVPGRRGARRRVRDRRGVPSGILAKGPVAGAKYDYADAPPEVLERVAPDRRRVRPARRPAGRGRAPVPAGPSGGRLGHPRGVPPGPAGAQRRRRSASPIPADLWAELKHEGPAARGRAGARHDATHVDGRGTRSSAAGGCAPGSRSPTTAPRRCRWATTPDGLLAYTARRHDGRDHGSGRSPAIRRPTT